MAAEIQIEEEETQLRHGADERLGLEGFSFGVRLIYEVLWEVAAP
ncbi:MAG: hypothetical protein V3U86_12735 [Acidobacteriota bacterium]